MKSTKLYLKDATLTSTSSPWVRIGENTIAVAQSVAFAESGGQRPDHGMLSQGDETVAFENVQVVGGVLVDLPDFPNVTVDGEIRITTLTPIPARWNESEPVIMNIDFNRRTQLSRSHSAAHLLWLALLEILGPAISKMVRGACVDTDGGRFDFAIDKFDEKQLSALEARIAEFVAQDAPVSMIHHPQYADCLWWEFLDRRIPCGGTHVSRSGQVGGVSLKRKAKGKGLERLIWSFT